MTKIVERLRMGGTRLASETQDEAALRRNETMSEAAAIIEALTEALTKARDCFNEYARHHQQIAMTDIRQSDARMEKADRNLNMALMCDRAINLTRSEGIEK